MKTLTARKDELVAKASEMMKAHVGAEALETPAAVAATCLILASEGHATGLAGQITARAEEKDCFYTQRLGLGLEEITEDNLLIVDGDLALRRGSGMPNPANRFHTWIYNARPDVNCIIHTHPPHTCALSMLGTPLVIAQMDFCALYDDVAFLDQWPGVPVGNSEGHIISQALGQKRAILLASHGLLVASRSVEEACVLAVLFERAARLQLLAMGAGTIRELEPSLAREAHDWLLQEAKVFAGFAYLSRRARRLASAGR